MAGGSGGVRRGDGWGRQGVGVAVAGGEQGEVGESEGGVAVAGEWVGVGWRCSFNLGVD